MYFKLNHLLLLLNNFLTRPFIINEDKAVMTNIMTTHL
jgi:hypothetical protein